MDGCLGMDGDSFNRNSIVVGASDFDFCKGLDTRKKFSIDIVSNLKVRESHLRFYSFVDSQVNANFIDKCLGAKIQLLDFFIIHRAIKVFLQFSYHPWFFVFVYPDRASRNCIIHLSCAFRFASPIPPVTN
jgi:hypothetical protein